MTQMTQEKKSKLQELLKKIKTLETAIPTGEIKSLTDQIIGEHSQGVSDKLKNDATIKYLDSLNEKIGQFKKDFNLGPVVQELNNLIDDVSKLREEMTGNLTTSAQETESKLEAIKAEIAAGLAKISTDSQTFTTTNLGPVMDALEKLNLELFNANQTSEGKSVSLKDSITAIEAQLEKIGNKIKNSNQKHSEGIDSARADFEKSLKDSITLLRKELMSRIGNTGGGNANRNIAIGGNTSVLSRYTDINLKAGSNVTLTYANNNTTKYVDVTISSSGGGGGSVGGTVRSINNISTSQTAGSNSGTDYVYICSAGVSLTLPTAAANTNLYTVKNTSSSSVLVIPDGVDTIDAQTNVILRTQYTSVDLISDGTSNWSIT